MQNEPTQAEISKEKFMAFELMRKDGLVNMFNVKRVSELAKWIYDTELTSEEIIEIMNTHEKLTKKFFNN